MGSTHIGSNSAEIVFVAAETLSCCLCVCRTRSWRVRGFYSVLDAVMSSQVPLMRHMPSFVRKNNSFSLIPFMRYALVKKSIPNYFLIFLLRLGCFRNLFFYSRRSYPAKMVVKPCWWLQWGNFQWCGKIRWNSLKKFGPFMILTWGSG